jgi:hypothetical protein
VRIGCCAGRAAIPRGGRPVLVTLALLHAP